jgi:hypothetical protein
LSGFATRCDALIAKPSFLPLLEDGMVPAAREEESKKAGHWCTAEMNPRRSIMKLMSAIALALFATSAFANETAAPAAAANTEVTAATTTATTETKVEKPEAKKVKAKKAKKGGKH